MKVLIPFHRFCAYEEVTSQHDRFQGRTIYHITLHVMEVQSQLAVRKHFDRIYLESKLSPPTNIFQRWAIYLLGVYVLR